MQTIENTDLSGDSFENIIAYEEGRMSPEQEIKFMQHLYDTGLGYNLQGHYGRRINQLLAAGLLVPSAYRGKPLARGSGY